MQGGPIPARTSICPGRYPAVSAGIRIVENPERAGTEKNIITINVWEGRSVDANAVEKHGGRMIWKD